METAAVSCGTALGHGDLQGQQLFDHRTHRTISKGEINFSPPFFVEREPLSLQHIPKPKATITVYQAERAVFGNVGRK